MAKPFSIGGSGRMVPAGEAKSVGRVMFQTAAAARAVDQAATTIQTVAKSVPASELGEFAQIARIYVDIWEKSREVERRLRAMQQRLDAGR